MNRWTQFLLCVLLSAGIWLVYNLLQDYTGVVNVPVLVKSSLKGRALTASESVTIDARCTATGLRLLSMRRFSGDVVLEINPEDLVWNQSDDRFVIQSSVLAKYSPEIFGDGVTLVDFLSQSYSFPFNRENNRTVPVRPSLNATYKPQFMATGPVRCQPDSVTVYGSESALESIEAVYTRPISLTDLSGSNSGVSRLESIPGVRFSESEVTWSLEVVRYVELRKTVSIGQRNVPAGISFSVFPSTAEAVFRCRFPARSNPADVCEFYVDYSEFSRSLSGNCIVHCDNLPAYVIDLRLDPEVVECMEMEDLQ